MNFLSQTAEYYTNYDYYYSNHAAAAAITPAVIGLIFLFSFIVFAVVYAIHAYLLSRIFKKAGISQGIAWIPFYNTWKLLEMGNQQGFWAVLALIPLVSYVSAVFIYIAMYHVGLKFGKDGAWVVLAIFLPTVWMAILAFDSSKWNAKKVKA